MYHYCHLITALGRLLLLESDERLIGIYFAEQAHAPDLKPEWVQRPNLAIFKETAVQLEEYATGKRRTFDLALALKGTDFQQKVWRAIEAIPFGETITYKRLAEQIGSPTGSRAAGRATGQNPISVIIPCHRVVGTNASLTGYAGGIRRKAALLEFERARTSGAEAVLAKCG